MLQVLVEVSDFIKQFDLSSKLPIMLKFTHMKLM